MRQVTKKKLNNTFKSTYSIGQKIWLIEYQSDPQTILCPICDGEKRALFKNGRSMACYKCQGVGTVIGKPKMNWYVGRQITVGHITFDVQETNILHEEYMCNETGIGTGVIYNHLENLFPTKEAAEKECNKRNKEE